MMFSYVVVAADVFVMIYTFIVMLSFLSLMLMLLL